MFWKHKNNQARKITWWTQSPWSDTHVHAYEANDLSWFLIRFYHLRSSPILCPCWASRTLFSIFSLPPQKKREKIGTSDFWWTSTNIEKLVKTGLAKVTIERNSSKVIQLQRKVIKIHNDEARWDHWKFWLCRLACGDQWQCCLSSDYKGNHHRFRTWSLASCTELCNHHSSLISSL